MTKLLISRIDKVFSELTVSQRNIFFREDTISQSTSEEIFNELRKCSFMIESEINSKKLNFQWVSTLVPHFKKT